MLKGKLHMRHRLLIALGLLALCAALAACGSSTTATATPASPTRAATGASGPAPAAATTAPTVAVASSAAPAATTAPTVAPTTAVATSAPTVPAASAVATTAAPAAGNIVAVQLKDFAISLDKSMASAGMVTFTIKNNGPSPHNFNVKINGEEKGVPTLDPGTTTTLTLDLKPGTYDYRCNIPGHDLLGMKGTLTVK